MTLRATVRCACASFRPFVPKPSCTFCGGLGTLIEGTKGWAEAKALGWPSVVNWPGR